VIKIAASHGLILGFVIIAVLIVSSIVGIPLLIIMAYIVGIIYATVVYRDKHLGGTIDYRSSLLFGILVSGFTSIIIGVSLYVFIMFNREEFRQIFNAVLERMKSRGYAVSDIHESMMYNPIFLIASYLFTGLLCGLIVSSITSILLKKK
jgi:hypothetical protein